MMLVSEWEEVDTVVGRRQGREAVIFTTPSPHRWLMRRLVGRRSDILA